jgi:hypothetical protein
VSVSRRYRAFISYSHSDERVAAWLHRSLENYRVPKRLRATEGEFGPVPERLNPIFRDREELASADNLGASVQAALADSESLIVICSPHAAQSHWVNEEVLAFKRLGRSGRIYCLIVDGEPNAGDARECFPPALRLEIEADGELGQRPAEPIAADFRPGKDGKTLARFKLIAGLLGTGLDTLRRREAQRRHRRMLAIMVASLAGMTLALVLAATAWIERNNAQAQQARAETASKDAQRRQAQAEDLLGFMLDDLRPKLEQVGRLDLLDSVGDKATSYFANLDPRDLTDATLAWQAQTSTKIGQVRLSQARFPEALASFQSAYARSSALAERHAGDGDRLFDRGQAEYWVGFVYWQNRDLDRAKTWLTRYRDTCREVYAIDPKKAEWEHELAYGDHNLAVLELERGQLDQAHAGFTRSRKTLESVLAKTPGDTQLQFEVADEDSWLGSVEEQLGNLEQAETLVAGKAESLGRISAMQPTDPKWKAEWSTSQLMESELLRALGKYAQAETLAAGATARMKLLTAHDPANKDWRQAYLNALITHAAARVGLGKLAAARDDLALAQPLLDASAHVQGEDRYVRRDLIEALSLRIMLALPGNDRELARDAANALQALYKTTAALNSAEEIGRYAMSQIAAGMAAADAGRRADADIHFNAAHEALAPLAHDSRYWRILDPWVRLSLLSGDTAEAKRVEAQLASYGYVALFPWPAAGAAKPNPGVAGATAPPSTLGVAASPTSGSH